VGSKEVERGVNARLKERLGVDVTVETVGPGETGEKTEIDRRQKPIRLFDERD
jgi:phenylacetate-CoA ligase